MARNLRISLLIPFALGFSVDCSSQKDVDIGNSGPGSALSDYSATWVGYTEAFMFDPTSDQIQLTLDSQGHGTLVVGDDPMPSLSLPTTVDGENPFYPLPPNKLVPGYAYPVYNSVVEVGRLRTWVNDLEPYRSFCEQQTPVPDDIFPGMYGCAGRWGTSCDGAIAETCTQLNPNTGETIVLSAAQFDLCLGNNRVCACQASGCSLPPPDVELDAALESDGTQLVGSLAIGQNITVRMTRN
jgi:hypothetical protein